MIIYSPSVSIGTAPVQSSAPNTRKIICSQQSGAVENLLASLEQAKTLGKK
jgi:hypothetical protein